jgi:hypothetical protein
MGAVLSSLQLEGVLKTQADTIGLAKILIHATASGNTDARTYSMPYSSYNSLPEFADDSGPFFPITLSDLKNYNPQMSFSPDADAVQQNLWEYWQIEVPSNSKKTNITFNFKLNYCCRYNSLDLYQSVLFENGDSGEINFIEFNFANREITVKGNLI